MSGSRLWISLCALCALCGEAFAASPQLSTILPRGGQRGTEVELTLSGARLGDAQELIVYFPGIAVQKVTADPKQPNQIKATVKIAPDCRLGEHAFRVRTASGVSDLRTFWVGALPVLAEKEPNTEFDKPQAVSLNVTVHGVVDNEDVDYFEVECKKGQRLSAVVEGMRLGGEFFDPSVAILDARRFELAAGDDSPATAQDGGCSVVIPADGKYYVQVRESAYGGNGGCHYRLHVGTFPRPTGVVPAGGRPGEEVEFRFVGDPAGEIKQKVKLPTAADPLFRLHCETADGVSPVGFPVRVVDLPHVVESGSNAAAASATVGVAPGAFHGVVAQPAATDYFKFTGKKGQTFEFSCFARRLGSPLDPVLALLNAQGGQLAANDDSGGPDSLFRATLPADGDYLLTVRDHLGKGGPDYFYRIEAAPVAPEAVLTVPRVDGNNPRNQDRQSLAVPKGGRFAVLLSVTRRDFGGALTLGFDGLPAGVTAAADTLDAGQSQLPVVFEAKADAAVAGGLFRATAGPTDPKQTAVPSRTALDAAFAIGPGNTTFHKIELDRLAAVVADPAPYVIEVAEPKAAVVQNGSMNLKVVVKRADGFKGPVTVSPLWTPPGMGIQGSVTIPEGQTEGFLSMNAAGNAAARKWKTAVVAVGDAGQGPVWTSSQLFSLEVAPPLATFAVERTAVDQGQATEVRCKVDVPGPVAGEATVKLLGLPAKATAPELKLTKDTKELVIPVTTDKATPAGKHNVFCQVIATVNGETVVQGVGGAELRVDVPLPPKPAPVAKPAEPAKPVAQTPSKPPEPKRLSRLEQLRLEQEEREKAGKK